jgi:mRNA interferase MazF
MTISEAGFRLGDVVVVPFPYSDQLPAKRRPALVISNEGLDDSRLVWIAMITSAEQRPARFDVKIDDIGRAGLSTDSIVRPSKIACIERGRIFRRAG